LEQFQDYFEEFSSIRSNPALLTQLQLHLAKRTPPPKQNLKKLLGPWKQTRGQKKV